MANRLFNQFSLSLEKQPVRLFAHVTFGASGAPTLVTADSKGVVSVARNSAGKFTFTLGTSTSNKDTYVKLLSLSHRFDATGNSGTAPAAPGMFLSANSVASASTFQVTFTAPDGTTATDPASGEGVFLEITLSNSNA